MPIVILIVVVFWGILGTPKKDVANWLYKNKPAPWEKVDAIYYPDRTNLRQQKVAEGLNSLDECRDWVYSQAASHGDYGMRRGDYECGVGRIDAYFGLPVYRAVVH